MPVRTHPSLRPFVVRHGARLWLCAPVAGPAGAGVLRYELDPATALRLGARLVDWASDAVAPAARGAAPAAGDPDQAIDIVDTAPLF